MKCAVSQSGGIAFNLKMSENVIGIEERGEWPPVFASEQYSKTHHQCQ